MVASATAWAQPAQPSPAAVDRAQVTAKSADQKLAELSAQRVQLRRQYDEQLNAIDRLKKQKASWRRDRELNKAQADANDTAKRLTALDNQVKLAQQNAAKAKTAVVVAIDAELGAGATGARAQQLAKLRGQLAPATPAPKKIVIPDAEIDPLADPDELARQAQAIADVERQLDAQRKGLDQQEQDLRHLAEVRSAHERAGELAIRDDDQPQRGAQRSTHSGGEADTLSPTAGGSSGGAGGGAGSGSGAGDTSGGGGGTTTGNDFGGGKLVGSSTFESSAAVALGEVIDKSTIEGMLRASRSGDPKQRAEAARMAREAVAKRLEQLRKKRAMIEARANQLRAH
jgi:hypothetical protein